MSLPPILARKAMRVMKVKEIRHLIAQAKAKQVLREVHETSGN